MSGILHIQLGWNVGKKGQVDVKKSPPRGINDFILHLSLQYKIVYGGIQLIVRVTDNG